MAKAQSHQIPRGYYALDTKVAKKTEAGFITANEEYTIIDYARGMYAFIGDNDKICYVDMYGGFFK